MQVPLAAITRLAIDMGGRLSLEALLQLIADRTAEIVGARRVSVRLLNSTHTHLLAVARAGESLHDRPQEFRVGEGLIGWVAANAATLRTNEPERHPSFVPRPGMTEPMGSFLATPILAGAEVAGVLSVVDSTRELGAGDEQLLVLIAAMAAPYVEIARLARLSHVDPLTGALNRRGLDEQFPEVATSATEPLAVIVADLDHFKRINDSHGHAVGDLVLRHVTSRLGSVVREGDAVVRYGGEEFVLVLPRIDRARAATVAERARLAVRMSAIAAPSGSVQVTISLGVAERRPGEARSELLARADRALYRAKEKGRDCVVLAD